MTRHHRTTPTVAWGNALRGAVRGTSLLQTTVTAATVGSILFMVNLYSQIREEPFTMAFTVRIALTYLVPWCNATLGIAIGLRATGTAPRADVRSQTGPAES